MKYIIIVLMLAFSVGANAQEVTPNNKKVEKTEKTTSQKKVSDKSSKSGKAKNNTSSCATDDKSKTLSNEPKSCKADGSCCGGGKKSSKE
jgi:hypothetical protein